VLLAGLAGCAGAQHGRGRAEAFTAREQPRQLPDLTFVDADGRERTLADFRGKAVLLNLWAPWCGPCAKEMPALDRLEARLGGPDFEVVALSIDKKGLPAARAFHEALGLEAIEPYADSARQALFLLGPRALPTTLLLDAQGREVARALGARRWDAPEVVAEIERRLDLGNAAPAQAKAARGPDLAQVEVR
jgi:thiol-disulfide isomerase/thioredoxin